MWYKPAMDAETRPGWERKSVSLDLIRGRRLIDALLYGDLAVHPMIDSPGWAITYAPYGLRISMGYRVFASEKAAMDMVEEIYAFTNNWASWFDEAEIPEQLRLKVKASHDIAETRGAFLAIKVAPTRHAV